MVTQRTGASLCSESRQSGAAYLDLIWSGRLRPVLAVVFFRHIILWNFAGLNRALIRIRSIFHAAHNPCFEGLPFFEQFVGALRVHALHGG